MRVHVDVVCVYCISWRCVYLTGEMEKLKDMALSGYTSLNIYDRKGRPTAYLAKKAGHKELADWLEGIGEVFVSRHHVIDTFYA